MKGVFVEVDCVIIGGGIAGMQAAQTFRRHWPDKTITLIDAEKEIGLLPYIAAPVYDTDPGRKKTILLAAAGRPPAESDFGHSGRVDRSQKQVSFAGQSGKGSLPAFADCLRRAADCSQCLSVRVPVTVFFQCAAWRLPERRATGCPYTHRWSCLAGGWWVSKRPRIWPGTIFQSP